MSTREAWPGRGVVDDLVQRARRQNIPLTLLGVGVLVALATGLGMASARLGPVAIIGGIALLLIGFASTDIGIIPLLAFPATLLMIRVGGAFSVSDLLLGVAALPAVMLYSSREGHELKPFIWLGSIYLVALLPSLILNPYKSNLVECLHQLFLVLASLVVGWVVGRRGQAPVALNLYVWGSAVVAVFAVVLGVVQLAQLGHLAPVYMPGFNKNFIGNSLAFAFLAVFVRPSWVGWSRRISWLLPVLALGIAASMARQAVISVVVALAILALRSDEKGGGKARVLLLALLPAVWYVVRTVQDQLSSGNDFNSSSQRLVWFKESIRIWETSPAFGVGQRWWYRPEYADSAFQPPNAFMEMLTSAGVVGLVAFVVMCAGAVWVMFRVDPRYGNVALVIMVARFTQGQLDLYWVAGQASVLWLVAGLALGVKVREEQRETSASAGADGVVSSSRRVVRA